jgi:hypothetical protein
MKRILTIILAAACVASISCKVGKGCPSSGRNVGAEKILSGDPKALKDIKRAHKFRS